MNSNYSSSTTPSHADQEVHADANHEVHGSSSRLLDEKVSDDSGTEATAKNTALAPAGLKNPFWSRAS